MRRNSQIEKIKRHEVAVDARGIREKEVLKNWPNFRTKERPGKAVMSSKPTQIKNLPLSSQRSIFTISNGDPQIIKKKRIDLKILQIHYGNVQPTQI